MKRILPLICLLLLLTGCGKQEPVTVQGFLLNTTVSLTLNDGTEEIANAAMERCAAYEKIFSRTDPESELYRLNHRQISQVSDELAEIIAIGLAYAEHSDGAFDITMGSVTSLWNFTNDKCVVPQAEIISCELTHTGWETVTLEGNTVIFSDSETVLDLGGIAKGYIADRLAEFLEGEGVTSAILDLGGNLYCLGSRTDGTDFQIGIQFPFEERNQVIGGVPVSNRSVVTSGVYERYFQVNDTLYHHILNPETGYPARSGLLAVSILSRHSVDGDALSTACFVLGVEKGLALIEQTQEAEAIFITEDFQIHLSSGLEGVFYETGR